MTRLLCALLFLLNASAVSDASAEEKKKAAAKPTPKSAVKKITYEEHIRPLFKARCFACHGNNKKEGALNLTTFATTKVGGGSGEVVEPGSAEDSYLWSLVSHDSEPFMPPKSEKLPAKELALIKAWLDGGALENSGSKFVRKKPKFNLVLEAPSTERPKVPAYPDRLGLKPTIVTTKTTAITALATSPWAPLCAVAGQTQILLYDTRTLQLVGVLPFPEGIAHSLKFSRNGNLLLAGGGRGAANGVVIVWDVKSGKRVFQVGDETDVVFGADISSDQSMIVLGSSAKVVRCFSTATGEQLWEVPKKHNEWLYCAAFSPDGVLVATSDRSGGLYVWEAETGRMYLELRGHGAAVTGLSWRADSNILASCSLDGTIRLWEMENGRQVRSWGAHGGGTFSVEFCRDGNLVSAGRDKLSKLFKQDGGQIRAFPGLPDLGLAVTYCDETKRVIAGDYSGTVRVYNAADGKQIGELSVNPVALDRRLVLAGTAQVAAKAENDKQQAASKAAVAAAVKVKADLDATNKTISTLQAKEKTLAANIKAYLASIKTLTAEQAAAAKTVAALAPVVPLLKETTDKAQATAAKATGDKELAAVAATLKTLLTKRSATLATAIKINDTKTKALAKTKIDLANGQKEEKTTKAGLATAQKRSAALAKALGPANDKAAAARKAAAGSAAALAAAGSALAKWKEEIEFSKVLDVFAQRETAYNTVADALAQADGELGVSQKELDQRKAATVDADKQYKVAIIEVTKATKGVGDAQKTHVAATKAVTALETAIPLLKEAQIKAEAAAKASADKELAAAAAGLKVILGKKVVGLVTAKKTVITRKSDVEKAKKVLVDMQKVQAGKQTVLTAMQKRVAEQVIAMKPAQAKAGDAKKTADASKKQLDEVQKQVDVFKAKTAAARAGQKTAAKAG